jgi:Fe-S oxidoreductase
MGEEAAFQTSLRENAKTLARYKFSKIVTACPHCRHALGVEYADFGLHLNVEHHSEFLAGLLTQGRLTPKKGLDLTATFHDPCYLGRYGGQYLPPRAVLGKIPRLRLLEMPRNREAAFCCGGGGGRAFYFVPSKSSVTDARLEEAAALKCNTIACACPYCLTMFEGSTLTARSQLQVRDIAELLEDSLGD